MLDLGKGTDVFQWVPFKGKRMRFLQPDEQRRLKPHDAITHAEDTVRLIRDLVQHGSIQTYIDGIQVNLNDLQTALNYAVETLERL